MNRREREVRAARRLISDEQLSTFLRAIRRYDHLFAVKLINEDLDNGESLDAIFYTGNEYGYLLSAHTLSASVFKISFGFQTDPTAGDGGEWQVSFVGDTLDSVSADVFWIS